MLQLLTIVLAIAFSLSNEPPQTALRNQDTAGFVELTDDGTQPPNPVPNKTEDGTVPPYPVPKKSDEYPSPPVPR